MNRPAVILADEPTGALEKRSSDEVLQLLRKIHAEGAALLVFTTRMEVAEALPGRIVRLEEGALLDAGGRPLAPAAPAAAGTVAHPGPGGT